MIDYKLFLSLKNMNAWLGCVCVEVINIETTHVGFRLWYKAEKGNDVAGEKYCYKEENENEEEEL